MAGPKKTGKKRDRYTHIDPDKPLNPKQKDFVLRYVKTKKITQSAIDAGYSPKSASRIGYAMVYEQPNTRKAIKTLLSQYFKRLDIDAFDVLQRTTHIAMTNASEITPIENGRVRIKDTSELSDAAQALFGGAEERINERGDVSIRVKMNDQGAALQTLIKYFGIIKKGEQETQKTLFQEQINAINAVQDGTSTVMEACLELEKQGFAIPDTLRILLTKYIPVEDDIDDGDMVIPSPEEMEAKRQERLAEIKDQKESFVPKRQAEVREIKKEMGKTNKAFSGGKDGEEAG